MFDIDEIMKRAQEASDRASRQLHESIEKSKKIAEQAQSNAEQAEAEATARKQEESIRATEQTAANQQRQGGRSLDRCFTRMRWHRWRPTKN